MPESICGGCQSDEDGEGGEEAAVVSPLLAVVEEVEIGVETGRC